MSCSPNAPTAKAANTSSAEPRRRERRAKAAEIDATDALAAALRKALRSAVLTRASAAERAGVPVWMLNPALGAIPIPPYAEERLLSGVIRAPGDVVSNNLCGSDWAVIAPSRLGDVAQTTAR